MASGNLCLLAVLFGLIGEVRAVFSFSIICGSSSSVCWSRWSGQFA